MNKQRGLPVSKAVPTSRSLSILLLPLLLASCSTSRLVDSDRVLDPGPHTIRSVIDSDILIPANSSLHVDYAAGNRIFVQSGGTLSGLSKGVQNSTIYVEEGSLIPARSKKSSLRIVTVDDVEQSFRDRFKNLLPANTSPNRSPSGAVFISGGALYSSGYYGYRHGHRHHHYPSKHQSTPSRSVSVKPDSYRSRN